MAPRRTRRALVPAVALASAVWLTGCGQDEPVAEDGTEAVAEESVDADDIEDIDEGMSGDDPAQEAAEVLEDPAAFDGETVTVGATVDEVVSDNMFTIAASDAVQGGLAVLHTTGMTVEEGTEVEVTGTVRQSFEIGEAEAFVGGEFDDAMHSAWEGDPYIQAESVEPIGG